MEKPWNQQYGAARLYYLNCLKKNLIYFSSALFKISNGLSICECVISNIVSSLSLFFIIHFQITDLIRKFSRNYYYRIVHGCWICFGKQNGHPWLPCPFTLSLWNELCEIFCPLRLWNSYQSVVFGNPKMKFLDTDPSSIKHFQGLMMHKIFADLISCTADPPKCNQSTFFGSWVSCLW